MRMQRTARLMQSGFTLIELIIVVVIVGIMAAIAIPKYNDIASQARLAMLKGIGGSISSAAATNYALRAGGLTGAVSVGTCTAAAALSTALPTGVSIDATALNTAGTPVNCTLTHTGGETYAFPVLGAT